MRKANRKHTASICRALITFFTVLLFAGIWCGYYNRFAFQTNRLAGGAASVLIYAVIYDCFARLYKAYKINAYPIGETLFSQVLSFGLADLVLYVECCLIHNGYVNIWPGLLTAFVQILTAAVWALCSKRFYIREVKPRNTLVIHGASSEADFIRKLQQKYSHIFDIRESVSSELPVKELLQKINDSETVILYEVAYGRRTGLVSYCLNEKKTFYVTPRISDILIEGFESRHLVDTPLLKYEYGSDRLSRNVSKRVMDILLSAAGLLLFSPVMLFAMLAIKLDDGGTVFFRQERYTRNWKPFRILKFRSMTMEAEKDGKARPCTEQDKRITGVGGFLRRYRIDELPQLWNVLKGDMSIVGPRPERVEHVKAYVEELPEFAYRLRVKGGLTGYAQIYGKYNTSAYDKLKLDLMYIENQSLLLDLKLILLTFKTIFLPESTEGFSEESSERIREMTLQKENEEPGQEWFREAEPELLQHHILTENKQETRDLKCV